MFFNELVALMFCDNKPKSNNCQPLGEAESHLLLLRALELPLYSA